MCINFSSLCFFWKVKVKYQPLATYILGKVSCLTERYKAGILLENPRRPRHGLVDQEAL